MPCWMFVPPAGVRETLLPSWMGAGAPGPATLVVWAVDSTAGLELVSVTVRMTAECSPVWMVGFLAANASSLAMASLSSLSWCCLKEFCAGVRGSSSHSIKREQSVLSLPPPPACCCWSGVGEEDSSDPPTGVTVTPAASDDATVDRRAERRADMVQNF